MPLDLIYEARSTSSKHGSLPDFQAQVASGDYPGLHRSDGEVLRVMGTQIGAPETDVMRVTAFGDIAAWESSLAGYERSPLVESETVRLLSPVAERPLATAPDEHHREFFGYRRFQIDPDDLAEVVEMSENGVWPRIEQQDARILGLWKTVGSQYPLEVTLLTGYHSPSHWEATRVWTGRPDHISDEEWESSKRRRDRRAEITRSQWVHLMKNFEFGPSHE
ncbi:MAG: hypothetical protein HOC77_03035 [Chloroflexi bacterium]|nr:hypothetical protein [Chloroflexota bacterium]MBT4072771.1 hypothetical protein [Chloroflexota bacterium]MBT4514052.1 hypothetical protein [Chloroflexota bacterium]